MPEPRKTRRWKSRRTAGDRIAVKLASGEEVKIDVLSVWNGKVSLAVILPDGSKVVMEMGKAVG